MKKFRLLAWILALAVSCAEPAGAVAISTTPGTLNAVSQCVTSAPLTSINTGTNSIDVSVTGTFVGTLTAETPNGATMLVGVYSGGSQTAITGTGATLFQGFISPGSLATVSVCMTVYTSGSAVVTLRASGNAQPFNNYQNTNLQFSAGLSTPYGCDKSVRVSTSTAGLAQVVALSGTTTIRICGFSIMAAGATTFTLSGGTGTNCGTGNVTITGGYSLIAQTSVNAFSSSPIAFATAGQAVCINNSAAVAIAGFISYEQS
jgi:hypothetical protein